MNGGDGAVALAGPAMALEHLAWAIGDHPDLARVAPFWAAILLVQSEAGEELMASRPLPWTVRRERLYDGRPQLTVDDLPLEAEPVRRLVERLEATWRRHDPGRPASREQNWLARVRLAFADPTLMFGQRRELGFEDGLAALALVPYLEWAAAGIAPALEGELEAWARGCCPVCGGHPDLAILAGDPPARSLVCSRCSTAWPYPRVRCPFCHDVERQAYHVDGDGRYRLYVCRACRRYLKTVDARRLGGSLDPRVERLVTIGIDLAALQEGYGPA